MKKHRSGGEYQIEAEEVSFSGILNLPNDLIYKIFCRVQVKAIARCKVVCRAWYNLLSAPDFMHYYAKNTPFTTFVLGQYRQGGGHGFSFVEISENGDDDCIRSIVEPKVPGWPDIDSTLFMIGSCNGLLCLVLNAPSFEVIYIYNPISGESISLPQDTFERYWGSYAVSLVYEFGFSPSTNNFKVLKVATVEMIKGEKVQRCEVFTVGVDHEWRRLEYSFKVKFRGRRIVLNGTTVCWLARDLDSTNIAAFDFGEEKLGHISHPPGLVLNSKNMELAALNHHLCLLDYSIPSHYTLWTMEEYGVAESWTKIVILRSCFPSNLHLFQQHSLGPMLRNGNILFPFDKSLMCYSPKQKECTVVEIPDGEACIYYISEFAPFGCIEKL